MQRITLDLPPSGNHRLGRDGRSGRTFASPVYTKWKNQASWSIKEQCNLAAPIDEAVLTLTKITFKDKRRRDYDNVMKCVNDALMQGGALKDDSLIRTAYTYIGDTDKVNGHKVEIEIYKYDELKGDVLEAFQAKLSTILAQSVGGGQSQAKPKASKKSEPRTAEQLAEQYTNRKRLLLLLDAFKGPTWRNQLLKKRSIRDDYTALYEQSPTAEMWACRWESIHLDKSPDNMDYVQTMRQHPEFVELFMSNRIAPFCNNWDDVESLGIQEFCEKFGVSHPWYEGLMIIEGHFRPYFFVRVSNTGELDSRLKRYIYEFGKQKNIPISYKGWPLEGQS